MRQPISSVPAEPVAAGTRGETAYSGSFYSDIESLALESAREIVPLVLTLVQPRSVVDVGCGTGAWLAVFSELGVENIHGIDGDWVDRDRLLIARENFTPWNLDTQPPDGMRFDLAVCMEVAEHLIPRSGDRLVNFLTSLAPVVLFSAAIPEQGGVNHLNEQWPSYWIERFRARGFVAVDWVRPRIWANAKVAGYYAQNTLLFVDQMLSDQYLELCKAGSEESGPKDLVHPGIWLEANLRLRSAEVRARELEDYVRRLTALTPGSVSLGRTLRALPSLAVHAVKRRLFPEHSRASARPRSIRRDK